MIANVSVGGGTVSLYFDVSVKGGDVPLLFLHSALASSAEMKPLRELFADRSYIMLDLPGHGRTTEDLPVTTDIAAEAIDQLLEILHVPQVDVVGYSLGGYVGLALARRSPNKVRSVATHAMKFYWSPDAIDNAVATFAKAPVEQRSIGAMEQIIRDFTRKALTADDIRTSNTHVLITTGERDEFVTPTEVGKLWSEVNNNRASLAIFSGAGHSLKKLPLADFGQTVREFWSAIEN
jgi:pimeloyl-ACP methyl ester carboxylesterase